MTNQQVTNPLSRDALRESFRQFLRQADKLIIERQFEQAKAQLAEAKKIDPGNPFIVAFEERIALFENKLGSQITEPPVIAQEEAAAEEAEVKAPEYIPPETDQTTLEMIEKKIRSEIDAEYREKFTLELRKAEEQASRLVEEERSKVENQQQVLKAKFENQVAEVRQSFDEEYQQKLDEEILKAEQRLEQQHQAELAFIEKEMKSQLTEQYEQQLRQLEERATHEREEHLEKERDAYQEHEKQLKEQFNKKLLAALRKTETVFRQQSLKQAQREQEQLRKQLTAEFQAQLEAEKSTMAQQNETLRASLEESLQLEQKKLSDERERQMGEQLELVRKRESEELDRKRVALRQELEVEFRQDYERRSAEESIRIQSEAEGIIGAEKRRLREEYDAQIKAQNDKIRKVRSDLQREMEKNFLKRLEQIAQEYDYKMELLGSKIPESSEECKIIYREKMRAYYATGQPSVEEAKRLMKLKELLELTFDDHLAVESDVRLELYVENVEKKILSAELNLQNTEALENLKQQFHITVEEASRLEPYILSSFQKLTMKGRLLVVDDDLFLLQTLSKLLSDCGYQVVTAEDVDTALQKLNAASADLILSDIKFPGGEFDGFRFYKAVQEEPHLRKIPFVFMSALQDGVIIRSGIQLGVDDYITKPMDADFLTAVIAGKLRRFRNMGQK